MTSSPRREWKSFCVSSRWSVKIADALTQDGDLNLGDPVSPSFVAYSVMSVCLRSAVIDTETDSFSD